MKTTAPNKRVRLVRPVDGIGREFKKFDIEEFKDEIFFMEQLARNEICVPFKEGEDRSLHICNGVGCCGCKTHSCNLLENPELTIMNKDYVVEIYIIAITIILIAFFYTIRR